MLTFDEAVAALPGGRFEGGGYRAPCPAHGGKDHNLSVWPDDEGIARFKCWSHGCGTKEIVAALGAAPKACTSAAPRAKTRPADEKGTRELVARLWGAARPPEGTIVQDYLFGRGWTGDLPWGQQVTRQHGCPHSNQAGLAIPASIRFHPRLKHRTGAYLPAMVAAVEDRHGEIVGVHRTFLKPDRTGKAEVAPNKMALGHVRGCSVHLTAGAPELVLCEGIETGLSILQATGRHVWATLGTANMATVELPGFVREVIIAADNDAAGLKAARAAAEPYRVRGLRVQIVSPFEDGADFNNLTRSGKVNGYSTRL